MNNNFGIYDNSYRLILETFPDFPQVEKVVLFGSGAMSNYKKGSDIDLALFGDKVDFETTSRLQGKLNGQLPIPYFVDVVNFNSIDNEALKQHILTEGKTVYLKSRKVND